MVDLRLSLVIFLNSRNLLVHCFSQSCLGCQRRSTARRPFLPSPVYIIPPPGSGYIRPEDNQYYDSLPDALPETYQPLMGYPGTMRPGTTPENIPYQDLPLGDNDEDVPWPHFQQIEWHHRWSEPPHPHPGTMEDLIEAAGRWATPEQEAAMRTGVRQGARAMAAGRQEKRDADAVITDDDEDDDEDTDGDIREELLALGDGVFGKLGSDDERAAREGPKVITDDDDDTEDALDDFLLDLGLDLELDGFDDDDAQAETAKPSVGANQETGDTVTAIINTDDSNEEIAALGLEFDSEDTMIVDDDDGTTTLPLEDFGDGEGEMDGEKNIFDEAGFDFDDGGDFDFDDPW